MIIHDFYDIAMRLNRRTQIIEKRASRGEMSCPNCKNVGWVRVRSGYPGHIMCPTCNNPFGKQHP